MNRLKAKELPDDIYIPFVETLFRDGFTLALGIVLQCVLISLVHVKTGNPAYLLVVLWLLVLGVLRLIDMRRINARPRAKPPPKRACWKTATRCSARCMAARSASSA